MLRFTTPAGGKTTIKEENPVKKKSLISMAAISDFNFDANEFFKLCKKQGFKLLR